MLTVSVVLETDSIHPDDSITVSDCLDALDRQTYPRERTELIVVDGGKEPDLEAIVRRRFPAATILELPGGTKFEMKNLGMANARGEVVAFLEADCAPPPTWLAVLMEELASAPADVAGVQGLTVLDGAGAREVSALFYGVRLDPTGRYAARLVTDNCAVRAEIARRFRFEHAGFSTVVDTLFLRRLTRAGYRVLFAERLRMSHSFPGLGWAGILWCLRRAYGVGYYMVRARQLEPVLRGSGLVRWAGLGWPLLALGKGLADVHQVWQNRRRLRVRLRVALPLIVAYETVLFVGGVAALLGRAAPRWS